MWISIVKISTLLYMLQQMLSIALIQQCDNRAIKLAALGATSVCGLSFFLFKWKKRLAMKAKSTQKRNEERRNIDEKLQELQYENVEKRKLILAMDAHRLIAAAQEGTIDPIEIIRAYLYKACTATKEFNSVTALIPSAEQQALALKSRKPEKNLLYGLPVSLKECLFTKGMDSTIGVTYFINQPSADDCVLAKVLKYCGAIPFVKTNVPQLMLSFGSSNPIFKNSGNPHNKNFTTGGSSAGEGSLIASGGSLLGFGTDIAGSIRNPSHMCGIAGLKPTKNRLSALGIQSGTPGQTLLASMLGPMAQNVDTLVLAMRALLCPLMFELDPSVPPMPFNEEVFNSKRKLRIGYYFTDGYVKAVPACQRAVAIAKDALERAGHTLIPFKTPRVDDVIRLHTAAVFADGAQHLLKFLRCSEVEPRAMEDFRKWSCPRPIRRILSFFIGLKWPRVAQDFFLYGGGDGSAARLWDLQVEASKYFQEFSSVWNHGSVALDAVICPPFPAPAGPQGSILENMTKMMSYTALYNLLNYPGGVVPVTKVNQRDIDNLKSYQGHYDDPWEKQLRKASESSIGMPVGVQCVTLPWQEELCLRVMKEIETQVEYQLQT